jgi:multimeric flavodoxin WrbA
MTQKPTIVAINGSPHAGIGNTSLMIEMLREPLTRSGFDLEVIELCDHQIDFCTGCGVCMDKGNCWIPDDHLSVVKRLLAAEGIVLASPVYFLHVTAQMKTFIDRSLAAINPAPVGNPDWPSAFLPARAKPRRPIIWPICCAHTVRFRSGH